MDVHKICRFNKSAVLRNVAKNTFTVVYVIIKLTALS